MFLYIIQTVILCVSDVWILSFFFIYLNSKSKLAPLETMLSPLCGLHIFFPFAGHFFRTLIVVPAVTMIEYFLVTRSPPIPEGLLMPQKTALIC